MPRPLALGPLALVALALVALALVASCSGSATSTTSQPATTTMVPPSTSAATLPPSTLPPSTLPPSTVPPSTVPPTTLSPTTVAPPTSGPPTTAAALDYVFPVEPPESTTYGPDHHDYPATDIFGPEGTLVVAVTSGVVDEVSRTDTWDPAVDDPATRGGLYVSLIGDDGVRYYYSHLLAVAAGVDAGARVEAGQAIGALGRSGNAAATPPHVHFGISPPTFPGDWQVRRGVVPPYTYLQDWRAGIPTTPVLP